MFTVTLHYSGDRSEVIENVNDVSFVGEYMVLCLVDLETRIVKPLSAIMLYTIVKFVPATAQLLGNASPSSEVAPVSNDEVSPSEESEVVPGTSTEPVNP